MDENTRRSLLGLFPIPDGVAFDQADIQQVLGLFREPLAAFSEIVLGDFIKKHFSVANPVKRFEVANSVRSFKV